jgi:hypothetical protein
MTHTPFREQSRAQCFRCGAFPELADTYYEIDGRPLCGGCWARRPLPMSSGDRTSALDDLITWICDLSWARFRR